MCILQVSSVLCGKEEYIKDLIEKEVGQDIFEKAYSYLRGSQLAGMVMCSAQVSFD